MRPDAPPGARTPCCWLLVLAWIGLHVLGLVLSGGIRQQPGGLMYWGGPTSEVLIRLGGLDRELVALGDVHRLITHAFLHASVLHVLLNTWVFLAVGRLLESVVGSARLWIVFVVSVVTGASAHLLLGGGLVVGASAGVFGVVGALGLWSLRARHPMARTARATALIFLVLSAALFFLPQAANEGHVGGLVGGALVMALLGPRRSESPPHVVTRGIAGGLLVVVLVAGVLQARAATTGPAGAEAAFIHRMVEVQDEAWRLADRPDLAKPEERAALGRMLDDILAEPWVEGWEGEEALRALVRVWRKVAEADIPDPDGYDRQLEKALADWKPYMQRLRRQAGGR